MNNEKVAALIAHCRRMANSNRRTIEYCVYVTSCEATGEFYIGKTTVDNIKYGSYVGSGRLVHEAIRSRLDQLGVPPLANDGKKLLRKAAEQTGWTVEIIERFDNEKAALAVESELIRGVSDNPQCLNIQGHSRRKVVCQ